jgi:hypothetical protein
MSLQQAAQHLAAQGRGKDTTLVHMTPNEVRGLQQIAMAAGGSLTLNPSTGLPEAGFLDDMMPMIIGAGLIAATGGAAAPGVLAGLTPGMIGLGVGGVQALRTGNLMEGVKAGLGAYGGAGLATGLMGAGTASIGQAAGTAATGEPALAATNATQSASGFDKLGAGIKGLGTSEGWSNLAASTPGGAMGVAKSGLSAAAPAIASALEPEAPPPTTPDANMGQRYAYNATPTTPLPQPDVPRAGSPEQFQSFGKEQRFFTPSYTKIGADQAKSLYGYAGGGPIEAMSNANSVGMNTGYPMADINKGAYATPWQTPISRNVVNGAADANVDPMTGEMKFASGGLSDLGGYSDGGRLLRGPGDGVSDSIPAMIGKKQPARLADGEFVVPARIVSELGNGSTEAGARKLYAMLDRVQSARRKTVGKGKVAKNSRAERYLPA